MCSSGVRVYLITFANGHVYPDFQNWSLVLVVKFLSYQREPMGLSGCLGHNLSIIADA